jgi:hypothetical protein
MLNDFITVRTSNAMRLVMTNGFKEVTVTGRIPSVALATPPQLNALFYSMLYDAEHGRVAERGQAISVQ